MKKVENYLETLKLKKCLFGGIAPKQIEIVIQEICMLYDLELYNKNNELEQERKKNEHQDGKSSRIRSASVGNTPVSNSGNKPSIKSEQFCL